MKIFRAISVFLIGIILCACAHTGAPNQAEIEAKGREFSTISQSKAVSVVAQPYVGVKPVRIRADEQTHSSLSAHVTLRQRGTLPAIVSSISGLTPLAVQIGADPAPIANTKKTQNPDPDLPGLLTPAADLL